MGGATGSGGEMIIGIAADVLACLRSVFSGLVAEDGAWIESGAGAAAFGRTIDECRVATGETPPGIEAGIGSTAAAASLVCVGDEVLDAVECPAVICDRNEASSWSWGEGCGAVGAVEEFPAASFPDVLPRDERIRLPLLPVEI